MTTKMRSELPLIPTVQQRAAVVMELAQSVARSVSLTLDRHAVAEGAWADLPEAAMKRDAMGALEEALKEVGFLAAQVVDLGQEVTIASENIRE